MPRSVSPPNSSLPTLVLATGNGHKVEEMRAIFREMQIPLPIVGLKDLGGAWSEPRETGTTFEENAAIKAQSYAAQTRMLCLADDSGLEVDALGGKPGVISSHYCTDGRETGMTRKERDAANNERLLRELANIPDARRSARFICVMALAVPLNLITPVTYRTPQPCTLVRGTFEGRIGLPPRVPSGRDGFGYDPLFLVAPEFKRTSAEMPPEEKNTLSHRRRAAELMAKVLVVVAGLAQAGPGGKKRRSPREG